MKDGFVKVAAAAPLIRVADCADHAARVIDCLREADHCVTVRERDSMEQVRIPISEVKAWIAERVKF